MRQITPIVSNSQPQAFAFEPTDKQMRWLKGAVAIGSMNPQKVADHLGIADDCWYKWMENLRFRWWWDQFWMKQFEIRRAELLESGFEKAKENHEWWRDMMRVYGMLPETNEGNGETNVNLYNVMASAVGKQAKERGIDVIDERPAAKDSEGRPQEDH